MAKEYFMIDGVKITAPDGYKPVFATTSTEGSDRTQDGVMHNTPMFTIGGYNLSWGELEWREIATILKGMIDKKKFSFHHKDPTAPEKWIDKDFYASNFEMAAQTLEEGNNVWTDLAINIRRIDPQ